MRPRVIWLDDDIYSAKLRGTVAMFRRNFDIIECETIEDFRTKSKRFEWDAAILDVLNKDERPEDVVAAIMIVGKGKPWFVFSGKESITREDNFVKKLLENEEYARSYASLAIYEKSTHDKQLIEDIENAVKNQRIWQVENQYERVLSIAKNELNDPDCRKHLLDILCAASGVTDIDSHLYYNRVRVILEWMFRAARKKGFLHDKCFDSQDRINLTDASLFMAGKPTAYSGVKCKVAHFPSLISQNVKNILFITGGASHTTEVEDKDILNLTAYWKEIDTPYLLFSIAFMLCDILVWFDKYLSEHPDIEANKQLWENIDLNDSEQRDDYLSELQDTYKGYVGVVEQDSDRNFHVGDCILPFKNHPPIGYKIKLLKVIENEKPNKDLYPVFAVKFDVLP